MHAEGSLNYDALMFVPSRAPWDMYSKDYKRGLALYSSNVLIMDKCEELLPDYFGFVRGVVDSSDLTLNISRETLPHNGQLRAIARRLEKKIKADLANMRDDDREAYEAVSYTHLDVYKRQRRDRFLPRRRPDDARVRGVGGGLLRRGRRGALPRCRSG